MDDSRGEARAWWLPAPGVRRMRGLAIGVLLAASVGCSAPDPVAPERYAEPDRLFSILESNVSRSPSLEQIASIDHSRLGAEAGSAMGPARVLIFSSPGLEARLLQVDPRVALDLPLRVLAYEEV